MNDRLIMDDYLMLLKSTMEVYVHGTLESSNKHIKDTLKSCMLDTISSQEDTYNLMVKNNWYQVSQIPSTKIKTTLNKLDKDA